jgi:phage tail sheath protein FI
MANFVSPGVYTIEKDISEYPVSQNSSIVGLVGFANKGPVNKATLITSQQNLVNTFGEPSESIPGQALEGAIEILETTRSIYFVRAASDDAADASALMAVGSCPVVSFSAGSFGVNTDLYLKVQVADNNGVEKYLLPKEFSIPSSTVASTVSNAQYLALNKVIGGAVDSDEVGIFQDAAGIVYLAGRYAGSSAYISVSAYTNSNFNIGFASALNPVYYASTGAFLNSQLTGSSIKAFGGSVSANGFGYLVKSLFPGTGYVGGTKADGTTSGNSIEIDALGNSQFVLTVNENGASLEQFKASFTSSNFLENQINVGDTDLKSERIKGFFVSGPSRTDLNITSLSDFTAKLGTIINSPVTFGGFSPNGATVSGNGTTSGTGLSYQNPGFLKLLEANTNLAGGHNGYSTDNIQNAVAIIGSPSETPKSGLYALDYDDLNISIAAIPDISNQNVQNALVTLAETSQNFLALVSPPYGAINTPQEAIEWSNGKSETRTTAINSSYAAVFWPWVKVFNVFDGVDRWYDPVIFAARQMCFTDSIADPWFAPAGFRRGRLTKPTEVEVNLNQGDRDSLYSGGNIINPIVNFPQQGITIFGQRTTQRNPTALDRINVRRLMIFLRKAVLASTQSFVFEPNDPVTWEAITNVMNPLLEDIRRRRGIINYTVVCDETTNTPVRVDRNELWCKVIIQPTKAAEVVVFELNVTNQSAKLGS